MGEYAASDNEIFRTVELEEKQLTRLERSEIFLATWLPEVHFR
jgi:hypothetical protein